MKMIMRSSIFKITITLSFAIVVMSCKPAKESPGNDGIKGDELYHTVEKYVSLGEHRTGTSADTATSAWLRKELISYGYDVKYLDFAMREFFPANVFLAHDKDTVHAFPLWWVNEQIANTVQGTLVEEKDVKAYKQHDIVLIHLPVKNGKTNAYIDSLTNRGVAGIVAITDNPSGEIQAYNTSKDQQPWRVPVILVAPKDSAAILSFVKQKVILSISGEFKTVQARNVYGKIGHGDQYIIISTPISGWFTCGGERGTGVAIWLGLAKWAAKQNSKYTFVFTGNSGHEHAFYGAHQYLESHAPAPEKTHLWIHFGAGAATLKYKVSNGSLETQAPVDNERRFFYNDAVKAAFDSAFKNIEAVKILANENPGGELAAVAQKGYKRFAGVSYAHPYFHVPTDDASTTSPEILESTTKAWADFIKRDE